MKPSNIQKNNLKSLFLSLAVIAVLSLMTSCTADEIETLPKNNPTTTLIKEQFLQRGDSTATTNKDGDIDPPKGTGQKP